MIEMTAGEAMLFAALLTAHGGHIGPDTINSAAEAFMRFRMDHGGMVRLLGVAPGAHVLVRAFLRSHSGLTAAVERAYFATGGATPDQRPPTADEIADHMRQLHQRFLRQREVIIEYQAREDAKSRAEDLEGVAGMEALSQPEIPKGYELVEPSCPGRWAVGNRSEVFESSVSLADAISMCRETLMRRRAGIG